MPRLLKCSDCLTLEILPDFLGNHDVEAHDPLLNHLVERHRGPLNREQLHRRPKGAPRPREIRQGEEHIGALMTVSWDDWNERDMAGEYYRRDAIIRQIWAAESGSTGFEPEFYATKDTFAEDAAKCFNAHRRPSADEEGCVDYRTDRKRLTPLNWTKAPVWLCSFCPYQSTVTTKARRQRGDYDPHSGDN